MMTIGAMYHLIPRLFNREQMYSVKLIDVHFWTSTIGVVLYIASMWIAGVMQGLQSAAPLNAALLGDAPSRGKMLPAQGTDARHPAQR